MRKLQFPCEETVPTIQGHLSLCSAGCLCASQEKAFTPPSVSHRLLGHQTYVNTKSVCSKQAPPLKTHFHTYIIHAYTAGRILFVYAQLQGTNGGEIGKKTLAHPVHEMLKQF